MEKPMTVIHHHHHLLLRRLIPNIHHLAVMNDDDDSFTSGEEDSSESINIDEQQQDDDDSPSYDDSSEDDDDDGTTSSDDDQSIIHKDFCQAAKQNSIKLWLPFETWYSYNIHVSDFCLPLQITYCKQKQTHICRFVPDLDDVEWITSYSSSTRH